MEVSAAPASLTTTFHHAFYYVTRRAFVEVVDLHVGDRLQTADGGEAEVAEVTPYRSTEVTYDLTIDELHTYYVLAGVPRSRRGEYPRLYESERNQTSRSCCWTVNLSCVCRGYRTCRSDSSKSAK